jgi:hypothetical protein
MQIRDRIVLLDDLFLLGQKNNLSEQQIGGLVDLLANLPAIERDTVIEYIREGDPSRIERLAKIAGMPEKERLGMLCAVGLSYSRKTAVDDFLNFIGCDNAAQKVREAAGNVATEASRELGSSFLQSLRAFLAPKRPSVGRERQP